MNAVYGFVLTFLMVTMGSAAPVFDIKSVAGKSSEAVQKILGAPEAVEQTKYGPQLTFKGGTIEIVFINKKADWISITPKEKIPFSPVALAEFGLSLRPPTFANSHVLRWEPCGEFVSASIFPAAGENMSFVYFKIATK